MLPPEMKFLSPFAVIAGLFFAVSGVPLEAVLKVAVSLPPQAEIVRAIGGDRVEVTIVLPTGVDHESFSPRPKMLQSVAGVDLYWATGVGFEQRWLPKLLESNRDLAILVWNDEEAAAGEPHHHRHEPHDHACHDDLHRWLDIGSVKIAAGVLSGRLIQLDPDGRSVYEANTEHFLSRCEQLRIEIGALLAPFKGRHFYVYHGAFGYFAEAHGLEQVALEREGREPSLRDLSTLISAARAEGVTAVYLQPQIQAPAAHQLARAIGADIVTLDPLAENWESNLRRIAETLARGFSDTRSTKE